MDASALVGDQVGAVRRGDGMAREVRIKGRATPNAGLHHRQADERQTSVLHLIRSSRS